MSRLRRRRPRPVQDLATSKATRGSRRTYNNNPQKRHQRRWQANQVLGRLHEFDRSPSDCVVSLCGHDDGDRRAFTNKGFDELNFLSVDRLQDNVRRVRGDGGLAVRGELADVIAAWPATPRVCALLLDFCGGLNEGNWHTVRRLDFNPATRGAVVAVNMQRGRDSWGVEHFARFFDDYELLKRVMQELRDRRSLQGLADSPLNRALWLFVGSLARDLCPLEEIRTIGADLEDLIAAGDRASAAGDEVALARVIRRAEELRPEKELRRWMGSVVDFVRLYRPTFQSYRSGPLVFDSGVWCPDGPLRFLLNRLPSVSFHPVLGREKKAIAFKRRLTAVLAVRQRWLNERCASRGAQP